MSEHSELKHYQGVSLPKSGTMAAKRKLYFSIVNGNLIIQIECSINP